MLNLNKNFFAPHRKNYIPAVRFFSKRVSSSQILPKLSRFINKNLYSLGIGSYLNRYDNSFTLYSSRADKKLYSVFNNKDLFINLGSGSFFHNRWKNYDFPGQSKYYKSLQGVNGRDFHSIDLGNSMLTIPEQDDSVSLIYCSHTLEHLHYESSTRLLRECYRILKPGGVLRVALPYTKNNFYLYRCLANQFSDLNIIKKNYLREVTSLILADTRNLTIEEVEELFDIAQGDSARFFNIVMEKHNSFVKFKASNPERHINYWDFEKLISMIVKNGFTSCIPLHQCASVASPFSNINVFDNTNSQSSFYADIIK